jgi:hypothetical protein
MKNKLFTESSADFLKQPEENKFNTFINNNKSNIAVGAAGLVGAGLAGYLGHGIGEDYGVSEHKDDIADIQQNIKISKANIENSHENLNTLSKVDPLTSTVPVDETMLRQNGAESIIKKFNDARDQALSQTTDPIEKERILNNYHAQLSYLQDQGNTNTKFLGGLFNGGEVKDYVGKTDTEHGYFSNDDLENPSALNLKNRALVDTMVKNAQNASNIKDAINPEDMSSYNNSQKELLTKQFNQKIHNQNELINQNNQKLSTLNTSESIKDYKSKFGNIGTGIGAITGAGASLLGASKLANMAKERKEHQEKERQENMNAYGENIPGAAPTQPLR